MDELVIPLRLDADEALRRLRALGAAGKEAGDKVDDAVDGSSKRLKGMEGAVSGVVTHFAAMVTHTAALNAISGAFSTIAAGLKDAADHATRLTKEFTDFRRLQVGAAGVIGEAPSDKFTLDVIGQATKAGVSPTQFVQFREAMLQAAVGNIGQQVTKEQFENITAKTTAFGVARDISPEAIATLTGALIRQTRPGADADTQVLDKFGKLVNLMDASPGKVERLLPELNEVMATGQTPQEAGKQIAVMAGRGRPMESGTYARAMSRAIRGLYSSGKAGAMGMTEGMSDIAATRQLYSMAVDSGVNMDDPRAVAIWLKQQGINAAEEQDAIMAMFNIGFKGGAAEAAEGTIEAGGAGAIDRSIKTFRESDEGRMQAAENQKEATRLRIGARRSKFALAKAETSAEIQGRLQEFGVTDLFREMAPDVLFGTREEQLTTGGALGKLEAEAIRAGVPREQLPFGGTGPQGLPIGPQAAQMHADTILAAIEKHMSDINRKTPDNATKPLAPTGQPPVPETRP